MQPYIASERGSVDGLSFSEGVNFAVAGATALDNQYYEKLGIHVPVTDASLGIQFAWFKQFLAEIPGKMANCDSGFLSGLIIRTKIKIIDGNLMNIDTS